MTFAKKIVWAIVKIFPIGKKIFETKSSQTPISFRMWFMQKILGFNRDAYWPVHFTSRVSGAKNIYAGVETCPGYMNNCYIQAIGKIYIGDYTQIAPGVGIISSNHDLYDSRKHSAKQVKIGRYCWLGMNSIVLPGVTLGDFTIVAAGAVVTKSFEQGYCVIGGNPAKVIKELQKENCIPFKSEIEYNGYIPASEFERYRKSKLNI